MPLQLLLSFQSIASLKALHGLSPLHYQWVCTISRDSLGGDRERFILANTSSSVASYLTKVLLHATSSDLLSQITHQLPKELNHLRHLILALVFTQLLLGTTLVNFQGLRINYSEDLQIKMVLTIFNLNLCLC